MSKTLSIIVSVYNEEEVLPDFLDVISDISNEMELDTELVFVDDGSHDDSLLILRRWKESTNLNIKIISFSRNFGHESAMICGIDHASGDAIVCMDSDLQHPPELLSQMMIEFDRGNEVITMMRKTREDNGFLMNWFSNSFYALINSLSEYKLENNASDFFLISKAVADVLRNNYRERSRFLRGFIQIVGFKKTKIEYDAPKRPKGQSKYSFFRLLRLSVNAVISFSKLPLYLGVYIGVIFAIFSFILGAYTTWQYIFGDNPPSGYTTIVLFLSLSFSLLFIIVGIIGTYVGFIFDENKGRPIYIIKNII